MHKRRMKSVFKILVDTCAWLDVAKDYQQQAILAALKELMECESLTNAEEAIAEIVPGRLQEAWGARINFEKLLEATNRLVGQSLSRGWGTEW
jgi:hypothetical protein